MATFINRALTIATVGLLSASPITIATNGIIQQQQVVEPPVVQPVRQQGGARVGERFVLEYAKRHEHLSALTIELLGQASFHHVHEIPSAFAHRVALDVFMWGDADIYRSGYFLAQSSIDVTVETRTSSGENKISFVPVSGEVALDSAVYARFMPADGSHNCTIATPIKLHSDTQFDHHRVEEVVRPVTHTHVSDHTATITGEAITSHHRVPIALRTARHEATAGGTLQLEGEASLQYVTSDAANYWHRAHTDLTVTPDATFTAHTRDRINVRTIANLHTVLTGYSFATLQHDVLPHAYNDDEEILVLFAQMMEDIDEG